MPQCDHIAETEPAITGAPDAAARAEMRAKRVEDALAECFPYGFVDARL